MPFSMRNLALFVLAAGLAACPQSIKSPSASAKAQTSAAIGTAVQLDGSASADPAGRALSFQWAMVQQPAGSRASLNDPHSQMPSFLVDVAGPFVVQLVVSNSVLVSQPFEITVMGLDCGNKAPVAAALTATPQGGAAGAMARPGQAVTLSAAVTDADSACSFAETFTYSFALTSRPVGSSAYLNKPNGALASLAEAATAQVVPDLPGNYQASVVVTDSTGLSSAPATVAFSANRCGFNPPSAGFRQGSSIVSSVSVGGLPTVPIALPQAVVTDADLDPACGLTQTFALTWDLLSRPAASSAILLDRTSAAPTFTPDRGGAYQLSVAATDSTGLVSGKAFVNLDVSTCDQAAPFIGAIGASPGATVGTPVTLTASPSDNNCLNAGKSFSYAWTLTGPIGSHALLSVAGAASPTFIPDQAGSYQVGLVVTNPQGLSSPLASRTFAVAACPMTPLTWDASAIAVSVTEPGGLPWPSPTPNIGALVTMKAQAVDANTCGVFPATPINYAWSLLGSPQLSKAQLSSPGFSQTTFSPDLVGSYQFSVTATDALGNRSSSPALVTVSTTSCGANPLVVTVASTAGKFDTGSTQTLTAAATTLDNDPASCPARFSQDLRTVNYGWARFSGPASASLVPAAGASAAFSATEAGDYVVQATGSLGSKTGSGAVALKAFLAPAAPAISAPASGTAGQSYTATVPARTGMTYAWVLADASTGTTSITGSAAGTSSADGKSNSIAFTISGPNSGRAITLGCTESNGNGSSATGTAKVNVVPLPSPASITVTPTPVNGNLTTASISTASIATQPGMTHTWTVSSPASITSAGGNAGVLSSDGTRSSITFTAAAPGPITLTSTATNLAGTSVSGILNVLFVGPASPPSLSGLAANLTAGVATFVNLAGTANAAYACSTNNGTLSSGSGTLPASPVRIGVANLLAGSLVISCTQMNAAGTPGAAATASATVWPAPLNPIQISGPDNATSGRTYSASVPAQAGSTYLWILDAGGSIVSAGGSAGVTSADGRTNSITFASGAPGQRLLGCQETNGAGAPGPNATKAVTVVAPAAKPPITAPTQLTATRSAGVTGLATAGLSYQASVPARAGYSYAWSITNGSFGSGAQSFGTLSGGLSSVVITAGQANADGSAAPLILSCTETNAAGDSSETTLFNAQVYANPVAPRITIVRSSDATATDVGAKATEGTFTASVPALGHLAHSWAITQGNGAFTGSNAGDAVAFSAFANADNTPSTVTLKVTETNEIGDTNLLAATRDLAVYPAPTARTITVDAPAVALASGGIGVTASRQYTARIVTRPHMTYAWAIAADPGSFVPAGTPTGASAAFIAGAAPGPMTLQVTETNEIQSSASGTRDLSVYPNPSAPAVVIHNAQLDKATAPAPPPSPLPLTQSQFAGYTTTIAGRPQMTYQWTITNGFFCGSVAAGCSPQTSTATTSCAASACTSSLFFRAGASLAAGVSITAKEVNAIGDTSADGSSGPTRLVPPPTALLSGGPLALGPGGLTLLVPTDANATVAGTLTRTSQGTTTALAFPASGSTLLDRPPATATYILSATNDAYTAASSSLTVSVLVPVATSWTVDNNPAAAAPDMTTIGASAIGFDPLNDLAQVLSASGQILTTSNGAAPWSVATTSAGNNLGNVAIAHPLGGSAPSIWVTLPNCSGELLHFNGTAWTLVTGGANGLPPAACSGGGGSDIVADRSDLSQSTFYAAFPGGVFRTANDGAIWTAVTPPTLPNTEHVSRLAISDGGKLFAGTDLGNLWTLSGTTWTQVITAPAGAIGITALSTDPAGANLVLGDGSGQVTRVALPSAGAPIVTKGALLGGGASSYTLGSGGVNGIAVAANGSTFAIANRRVFRSQDLGLTFTDETWAAPQLADDPGGYKSVAVDPAQPQTVYVVSGGIGVWRRTFGAAAAPAAGAVTLATGITQPSALAVDGAYAYVAGSQLGTVYKSGGKLTLTAPGPNLTASALLVSGNDVLFGSAAANANTAPSLFDADTGAATSAAVVPMDLGASAVALAVDSSGSQPVVYLNQKSQAGTGTLSKVTFPSSTAAPVTPGTATSILSSQMYLPGGTLSGSLYFCGTVATGAATATGLFQMAKAGATPTLLDQNPPASGPCAFSGNFAYYTKYLPPAGAAGAQLTLYKLDLGVPGGVASPVFTLSTPVSGNASALATDGLQSYLGMPPSSAGGTDGYLARVANNGSGGVVIAPNQGSIAAIAVDKTNLFWATASGTVLSQSK